MTSSRCFPSLYPLLLLFLVTLLLFSSLCLSSEEVDTEESCSASYDDDDESNDNCSWRDDIDEMEPLPISSEPPEKFPALVEVEWGVPQLLEDMSIWKALQHTNHYMKEVVMQDSQYDGVREKCILEDEECLFWAANGECATHPGFMHLSCAPACQCCELLDYKVRCPFDETQAIWRNEGSVKQLFEEGILKDESLEVTVWSQDPWIAEIDDFLSPEECQTLIDWGTKLGYQRSEDVGEILEDGTMERKVNEKRTSTNAWCMEDCYEDEVAQSVMRRVQSLIQVPKENFEYFQLLKYEEGEFYEPHTDYIPAELGRAQGNRILTIFLYLNDVEEGGGTRFPELENLTITPKKGRALIWPNVLDDNPFFEEPFSLHEALPVEKGVKYGANIWVHQRDFQTPHAVDCI